MEYNINQFNLSDINFSDFKSLITYFQSSIPLQKTSSIYLGPSLLHFSLSSKKLRKKKEDKKLISILTQLLTTNHQFKPEQSVIFFSTSNNQSKIFLKRFLKSLTISQSNLSSTVNQMNQDEIQHITNIFNFISFFTCIKDEKNDEIPLSDFSLKISNDKNILYDKISMYQFNYEMLFQRNNLNNMNNIHYFYMLLYNLPKSTIEKYLLCDSTIEYFKILNTQDNENNETSGTQSHFAEYAKRYIFINQFKLIKNETQFNSFAKTESNALLIKNEYLYYKKYYEQYVTIRDYLMINEQAEQKLIGIYLGILLLYEYDICSEPIYKEIVKQVKSNLNTNSSVDLFTFIRNVVIKTQNSPQSILSKISSCLNISPEKLLYLIITNIFAKVKGKIVIQNNNELFNNIDNVITILYQISIDKVKNIIDNYNNQKKLIQSSTNNKIIITIMRSNLVYEYTFNSLLCSNNPYFTISNNIIDSNSYIIEHNVREHALNNYIQEKKNYIYLSNALTITKSPSKAKMKFNDEFIIKLFKENFTFETLLNLYENQHYGLLKYIQELSNNESTDATIQNLIKQFKSNFNNYLYKKGICEIVEVFNSETQQYITYIKIKHSFGTFLYDLNGIFHERYSNTIVPHAKEQIVYKFLEYKPFYYGDDFFKYNFTLSKDKLKKLESTYNYIVVLIQMNKFNLVTLIDDLKINNIYYFYANFFNFYVNVKTLKDKLSKHNISTVNNNEINSLLKLDDLCFFKKICKKIRISIRDYYYDNGYIYARNRLNNAFDENRNISSVIFKFNQDLFLYLLVEKFTTSNFNYFKFAINGVRAFVKLTKIYNEKRVLSNVRNLLTDVIMDNYDINSNNFIKKEGNDEIHFNSDVLPQIDKLNELVFDFKKESLSNILPKLRANLAQLKKVWKNYVSDINYLEQNKKNFSNQECTQLVIEQRMVNFQILLFLFSKQYKFINSESVKKYGVLMTEFIKTVSAEVLSLLNELYNEFQVFLKENNWNLSTLDNINIEKLITKRIELQQLSRKNSLKSYSDNTSDDKEDKKGRDSIFNIPMKELIEGRHCNRNSRTMKSNNSSNLNSNTNSFNNEKKISHNELPLPKKEQSESPKEKSNKSNQNNSKGKMRNVINNTFSNHPKDEMTNTSGRLSNRNNEPSNQLGNLSVPPFEKGKSKGNHRKFDQFLNVPESNSNTNRGEYNGEDKDDSKNKRKKNQKEKDRNTELEESPHGMESYNLNEYISGGIGNYDEEGSENNSNKNRYTGYFKNRSHENLNEDNCENDDEIEKNNQFIVNDNLKEATSQEDFQSNPLNVPNIIQKTTFGVSPKDKSDNLIIDSKQSNPKKTKQNDKENPSNNSENKKKDLKNQNSKDETTNSRRDKQHQQNKNENLLSTKQNMPPSRKTLPDDFIKSLTNQNDNLPFQKKQTTNDQEKQIDQQIAKNNLPFDFNNPLGKRNSKIKGNSRQNYNLTKEDNKHYSKNEQHSRSKKVSNTKDEGNNNEISSYVEQTENVSSSSYLKKEDNIKNEDEQIKSSGELGTKPENKPKTEKQNIDNKVQIENLEQALNEDIKEIQQQQDQPLVQNDNDFLQNYEDIDNNNQLFKKHNNNDIFNNNIVPSTKKNTEKICLENVKEYTAIPSLKELDEKISQLKKELNALDIMENLTEQTSLLCFKKDSETDKTDAELYEKAKLVNKDFYDEIEQQLQMAEEAINCQFKQQ